MVLWLGRYKARRRIGRSVRFWYHPAYSPPALKHVARVPNLQVDRSELVIEQLAREGLLRPRDVTAAGPATVRQLARVHAHGYLEQSARAATLAHIFGLPPEMVAVDELVAAQRLAVGGTIAAARAAIAVGGGCTFVNLGGGFHHAKPEGGSGFCVYNDVAVAIAALRADGMTAPIAIVDLDFHQGDGSLVAFASDPTVLTYSVHGAVWTHVEAVADVELELPSGTDDATYLATVARTLPRALDAHRPELVFFVAGNDVLSGDRLGDFSMTTHGVLRRDREVVDWARDHEVPLVITLGGGYSDRAWQCTASLARWLLTDVARAREERRPDVRTHFARIAHRLDPSQLQQETGDPFALTEEDILGDLAGRQRARLVLDYYSAQGIELALEQYGFLDRLRDLGFFGLRLEVDPSDVTHQSIRVFGRADPGPAEYRLVELVLRRANIVWPLGDLAGKTVETLFIEWLLLQNPTASFTLERPRLPGQEHPGLGLSTVVSELLRLVCHRIGLEGVVHRPAHFHTASVGFGLYHFLDPVDEGRLLALRQVLAQVDLRDGSVAVASGRVQYSGGSVCDWHPADRVMPVSDRVDRYFADPAYASAAAEAAEALLARGLHLAGEPAKLP